MNNYTGKRFVLLISAALSVLLISIIISMLFLNSYKSSLKSISVFNSVRLRVNPVLDTIKSNYNEIYDYPKFCSIIKPEFETIKGDLTIVNLSGTIIFDYHNKERINEKVNLERAVHYDAEFKAKSPENVMFSFPIIVNGTQTANALFSMPSNGIFECSGSNGLMPFIPLVVALAVESVILLCLYKLISNSVLKPVKKLNSAIPEIVKGNLNINLEDYSDSEIGEFTRAFDLMKEELKEAQEKKGRLEKERKELIASISHDIKTPLSYIKAYAEGLRDGIVDSPEEVQKYLSIIIEKTDGLTGLANDLLNHSIKDLGNLKIELREMYSKELIINIIEPLRIKLERSLKNLEIEDEIPDVLINVDPVRFEQVFVNLIQNAEKYASINGKIMISVKLEDDCLLISVSDNGMGIPPEELPFIFDSFYRGGEPRKSNVEGAGLGLSICKYIIEQHGGSIFAQSIPGKGSIFSFTIPKI